MARNPGSDYGIAKEPRTYVEFRVVDVPPNDESGVVVASGWVQAPGNNWTTEAGIRNLLVVLGIQRDEAEIFMGQDLI